MKWLRRLMSRRIVNEHKRNEDMMHLEISEADAAQVKAILQTHAEMQDARIPEVMSIMARLKRDEPDAGHDTICDLQDQVNDFEADSDNLLRIARLFGEV